MKSVSKSLAEPHQSLIQHQDSSLFFDKATKSKIQRHLTDINDHITEDDIRNIDTNITANLVKSGNLSNDSKQGKQR